MISLMNETKYPLYDVMVNIEDFAKSSRLFDERKPKTIFEAQAIEREATATATIGTISPSVMFKILPEILLPTSADEYRLRIEVIARNRSVTHEVLYKKDKNGVWSVGSVTRDGQGKRLATTGLAEFFPEEH